MLLFLPLPCFADANREAADRPLWQRLLHLDADGRSRIDSPAAFLAPDAENLALGELLAALERLDSPAESVAYQCRFPARSAFLRQHFPRQAHAWPPADCPDYQAWRQRLGVRRVTLVFASAYLNNPSSMFGHTLLRLDGQGRSPLLSWAVNFAAQTRDRQGLSYAWKGVTGGYAGRFGIYPYYDKVREYARIENRDLWEYELDLTAKQLDRLLAHLWELRELEFDYFFFDENCSFQLLALLEVARPDLELTRGFKVWAAPVDTVRRLREQPGLIAGQRYRPALQTRLAARIAALPPAMQQDLDELLQGRRQDLPDQPTPLQRARLAELVHDWAWYQLQNTAWISGAPGEAQRQRLRALRQQALDWRRQLPAEPVFASVQTPAAPDAGPASQRLSLGGTWDAVDGTAALLGWRPVLRDLLDPPAGWDQHAAIEVLNLQFGIAQGRLRPQLLRVIGIESRPPRDRWFSPWAWQIDLAYSRPGWNQTGWMHLRGGLGASWPGGSTWQLDMQAVGDVLLGPHLDRGLAVGLEAGLRGRIAQLQWRLRAQSQTLAAFAGQSMQRRQLEATRDWLQAGLHWSLSPAWGLRLQLQRYPSAGFNRLDLLLQRYF